MSERKINARILIIGNSTKPRLERLIPLMTCRPQYIHRNDYPTSEGLPDYNQISTFVLSCFNPRSRASSSLNIFLFAQLPGNTYHIYSYRYSSVCTIITHTTCNQRSIGTIVTELPYGIEYRMPSSCMENLLGSHTLG